MYRISEGMIGSRGPYYWVQSNNNGRRKWISLGGPYHTKEAAERYLKWYIERIAPIELLTEEAPATYYDNEGNQRVKVKYTWEWFPIPNEE